MGVTLGAYKDNAIVEIIEISKKLAGVTQEEW
jgi:hypothetical protein